MHQEIEHRRVKNGIVAELLAGGRGSGVRFSNVTDGLKSLPARGLIKEIQAPDNDRLY